MTQGVDVVIWGDVASPHTFSPSQVETYLACHRKWGFGRIAKVERIEGGAALLGSEVHAQLENYLAGKGLDFTHPKDAGYIAAAGVHLIPSPDDVAKYPDQVGIETEFRFKSPATGFVWNGRKDLELADSRLIPDLVPPDSDPVPAVLDHKSTGAIRWAKTPEDLRFDVQANIYAYALMTLRRVLVVDLVWVYYQTKGARAAKRTHLRVHHDHASRMFRLIENIAGPMAASLDAAPGHDDGPPDLRGYVRTLKPNPKACSMYGGCPYESVCQLSLNERMSANMSNSDASFFDSLKDRAADEDASKGVMGCAPEAVPAPNGIPSWLLGPAHSVSLYSPTETPAATAADAPGINPPESALPEVTLPPVAEAAPVAETATEKPKRTRRTKEQIAADKASEESKPSQSETQAKDPPSAFASFTKAADDAAVDDTAKWAAGFTLYVDSFPVGVPYETTEKYIARAKDVFSETKFDGPNGPETYGDYRFMPFGKGPGVLAALVMLELDADPPTHLVVSTGTPEGALAVSDLVARASFVVRGLR